MSGIFQFSVRFINQVLCIPSPNVQDATRLLSKGSLKGVVSKPTKTHDGQTRTVHLLRSSVADVPNLPDRQVLDD